MKKSLFLLGVAAAVFSGCSNQEVMDVAEYANQPIEFTTFVDKTTRSGDVTSQNFQKFWVFAQNKGTGDQNWADAFTNVQVSKAGDNEWLPINTYYWEKNKEFRFAGYANGESQLNKSIVSYDAGSQSGGSTSGLLTFTAYSTDGKNDLVAAMGNESNYTWDGTASGEAPKVSMTFRHMLSKLTFTFKTKMANTYTVANQQAPSLKQDFPARKGSGSAGCNTIPEHTPFPTKYDPASDCLCPAAGPHPLPPVRISLFPDSLSEELHYNLLPFLSLPALQRHTLPQQPEVRPTRHAAGPTWCFFFSTS